MSFVKKEATLLAVCNGRCGPLSEMPDEAFSSGMLGLGVALFPEKGLFVAPCDAIIETVAETGHAYSLRTSDGVDLLIHVGVDTVTLKGEGFRPLVKEGERVRVGSPIAEADLALIQKNGLSTATALLIGNAEVLKSIDYRYGTVEAGRDTVLLYRVGKKG